ncbi:MAG TPA: hypothetical protein VK962_07815 [Actinomycetota bacterium]|jgi:hypothetical protein|nr:hypothetical protein [Actinomycetota bacterium]
MKDIYRTERGTTLRIARSDEGALAVEVLKDGMWASAPIAMAGLRLQPGTRRLRASEIRNLPA